MFKQKEIKIVEMQTVAGGIIIKKNKFLFGKRVKTKSWAPGKWDIVGGRAKENESAFDALKRETKEETGITILHATLLTEINLNDEHSGDFFKYFIYVVLLWKGTPSNCSGEHTKLRWLTRKQLQKKKIALPEYVSLIDNFLMKQNFHS